MPELNLNYAPRPPWLEPPEGNSFQNLLAATSSARQGRQLGMQEKELASRLVSAQQDQQMNDLKLTETLRQRNQLLEAELAAQGLGDLIAPLFEAGKPFDAMQALLAQGVRNPILFKAPQWQVMMKEAQVAATAETARLQIEALKTYRATQNTRADKRISNEELRLQLQATGMGLREIDQMIKARELGYEINGQPDIPNVKGEPGGPAASPGNVTLTPVARPLTTPNVTAAQTDVLAARSAIASIDQAIATLVRTPGAAGIVGAGREIAEGVAGQIGIDLGTEITAARTQLRETAHQLVSALRVESGQMSNWEREMLEDVASPLNWKLDDKAAIAKMATIKRLIGLREVRRVAALHQQSAELDTLTDKDLVEMKKAGFITPEAARAEYQRRGRQP